LPRIGVLRLSAGLWEEAKAWTRFTPDDWEKVLKEKGLDVELIPPSQINRNYTAIVNPFGETYPETNIFELEIFKKIMDFVADGGTFVCAGGYPFFYAYHIETRRVRVIASAPKLQQWIENHPLKEDPNAPLWVTIGTNSKNKVLNYATAKTVLKKLAKKAGIKKRIYPHLFRHSRATHLANHLTEAQMNQYFGWVQGSKMASIYVHLSGRDVVHALLKLNGMKVDEEEEEKEDGLKPKICQDAKLEILQMQSSALSVECA